MWLVMCYPTTEEDMVSAVLQRKEVQDSLPPATAPTRKLQDCVLLIEDDQDAMLLVQYALHKHGNGKYRLVWANNLSNGLSQLAKTRVDVVVLDLGLPESSGPATYACVREASAEVPVVVLTGDTSFESEFLVLESGVEEYLKKDQISGSVLLKSIETAVSAGNRRQNTKNVVDTLTERFRWTSRARIKPRDA